MFVSPGCLCVFNSDDTLKYVRDSLERSLHNDIIKEEPALSGMPITIIQAANSSQSEKYAERLTERAKAIAKRYD